MRDPIIIVGAGLAGYQLAREFRKIDTETPVLLVTADDGHFYSKPQLSVALTSQKTADALITIPAARAAEQFGITLMPNTALTAIDPAKHTATLNSTSMTYHKLVLACGAEPARPPLVGRAAGDVMSVNHISDYAAFRDKITDKKHITLLGAGLIGCEFANDLQNTGHTVHVITPAATPLELLLPEVMATIFQKKLTEKGIHFHTGCTATDIDHAENGQYKVTLSDGSVLITDVILAATGLRPVTAPAKNAGIATRAGITTNRFLETSAADIYAIGDCAEVEELVLPYITPLLNCTRALARTLSGTRTAVVYPAMPVTIKTPACPVAVCPPPKNMRGTWTTDISEDGARALFHDEKGVLHGFVLLEKRGSERNTLAKDIPPLI